MGGRGSRAVRNASFERSKSFDQKLFEKLPKKLQVKNITDIGKEKTIDGTRYHAVIEFEDGFTRSVGEYTFSEFKSYIDDVLNKDRNIEY